ncbi:MAG: pyruvate:ferredoxin (flavodoxin) oxidoreductase [Fimbriimonadales bacterium]
MTIDGNEACVNVAYRVNEVCSIFPITPATPMAELADQWSSEGKTNIWGSVVDVIEMQSELGAAGTLHGALISGSLATSFTSSQGLMLMIPNMFKIAGELTPCVIHVAARAMAANGISIFCDHQDVMAVRPTGFAQLAASSVQEAHDFALIAQASTLESRIPFLHFMDGFRTSHEVNKIELIEDDQIRTMIDEELVLAHRNRAMNPDKPDIRGTVQNNDIYFQARETANPFYNACPGIVQAVMDRFAGLTGRQYRLFDYYGHPEAERLIVIMGSGAETARETAEFLCSGDIPVPVGAKLQQRSATSRAVESANKFAHSIPDSKVGVLQVHLFRPFSVDRFIEAVPRTVRSVAVLDRTKEPGASGEPLYLDVVDAFAEHSQDRPMPKIIGGRYGLAGKEFHPGMVKAVFDELEAEGPPHRSHFSASVPSFDGNGELDDFSTEGIENPRELRHWKRPARPPKNHFTVGIVDDVTHTSLEYDPGYSVEPDSVHRAVFYGLGADGTVGANKNTVKILGDDPGIHAQAYFVYDSKKSGSQTVSHLRFGPDPIRSTYLIRSANFIGCHAFGFIDRMDVLQYAAPGATLLLNSPYGPGEVWNRLPRSMQETIIEKRIDFYVIDATQVARETGLGARTNTVLQTCFFAISGVLPREKAIAKIKESIEATYGKKGDEVVRKNFEAVDTTLARLHKVSIPTTATGSRQPLKVVSDQAPEFVRNVTAAMIAGKGNDLPVSAMPITGAYPSGTTKWEKRNVADFVPVWNSEICIQCGNCGLVCPHSCIRSRLFDQEALKGAPEGFQSSVIDAKGFPETRYTLQIYMEDCTGCALCVDACPVKSKEKAGEKAINMVRKDGAVAAGLALRSTGQVPIEEANRTHLAFFESLPVNERAYVDFSTVRGTQFLEPLFEFSGACAGCGETPYPKLLSQLFGDRMMVANASGCSSVFGGCLPTTPWSVNHEGRGPAWANSLFEDNAEFGLGMRIAADRHMDLAHSLLRELRLELSESLVDDLIHAPQRLESEIRQQRERVAELKRLLKTLSSPGSAIGNRQSAIGNPKSKLQTPNSKLIPRLLAVADHLVRRSVWIVGGDGWAYDIGSSGVDHVLASGRDVNMLVLDNEVYANTGGQQSKATPLGAVAKFANAGKQSAKKDIALQAIAYGNVYVARVALGANPQQTLTAFREAEAYCGPSLIIAYSHCIAHGINMEMGLEQQKLAVHCGYWPLIRFNPEVRNSGEHPFVLDSARPGKKLKDYTENELRYRMLRHTNPKEAEAIFKAAQDQIERHWALYEQMAGMS